MVRIFGAVLFESSCRCSLSGCDVCFETRAGASFVVSNSLPVAVWSFCLFLCGVFLHRLALWSASLPCGLAQLIWKVRGRQAQSGSCLKVSCGVVKNPALERKQQHEGIGLPTPVAWVCGSVCADACARTSCLGGRRCCLV